MYTSMCLLPLDIGNESQLDQPLFDPLTYDRLISKSLIPNRKSESCYDCPSYGEPFSGRPRGERGNSKESFGA